MDQTIDVGVQFEEMVAGLDLDVMELDEAELARRLAEALPRMDEGVFWSA
jgi:acyl CoA:acetate/3-ketoacid CoA transferase